MLGGITGALLKRINAVALIRQISMHSLGRADVTLRHAKGKIAGNRVYACALPSAHGDTHGTKGKKGMISRMSDQANGLELVPQQFSLATYPHTLC